MRTTDFDDCRAAATLDGGAGQTGDTILKRFLLLGAVVLSAMLPGVSSAAPIEYVKICSLYGTGYVYIPGTTTCMHVSTGETREQTASGIVYGQTDLARRIEEQEHQSAISNALEDPDLVAGERFGVRINWGAAGEQNAFGVTGMAVIHDSPSDFGGRLTASGGIAFSGDQVGGRAGLQLSW